MSVFDMILNLIERQRLAFLVEGAKFYKLKKDGGRERNKFTFCKLSPNHKNLYFGDWNDPDTIPTLENLPNKMLVSDMQNCGNILAGVGPFSIERGLVKPQEGKSETKDKIFMENTGQIAIATVQTTSSKVVYDGNTQIDGVPRPSSPIPLEFLDIAGSMCGRLLPTGNQIDTVNGLNVTMIDNGMPCVIIKASDLKITGYEDTEVLEKNLELRKILEELRKSCGQLMNLGDVSKKTVPKMTIVSTSKAGGIINTSTFIPHRCHSSIGVFGAVSVATACLLDQTITAKISSIPNGDTKICSVEHPSGQTQIVVSFKDKEISSTAILRTARKLLDGIVFSDLN